MKRFLTIFFTLLLLSSSANCAEPPQRAVELYNSGIDYYQMGEVQKSISSFNEAIKLAPDFYEAYYNLGQIQASNNKLDDAIKTYTSIYNMRPSDDENLYSLAKVLYKRGFLAKSLTYYSKISPSSTYFADAQKDIVKVTQRQKELQVDAAAKANAASKLSTAQTSVEKKFANQNQIAGAEKPFDKKDTVVGTISPKIIETKVAPQRKLPEINPPITNTTINSTSTTSTLKVITYEGIQAPSGVATDSAGNLYIASFAENTIYKITPEDEKTVFANAAVLNGPVGIAIDEFDNLYVANYTKGNVLKITPAGSVSVLFTVKNPYCLNVSNNTLFISEQGTNTVIKHPL